MAKQPKLQEIVKHVGKFSIGHLSGNRIQLTEHTAKGDVVRIMTKPAVALWFKKLLFNVISHGS